MTANEWEKRVKCGHGAYPPDTEYEAIIADLLHAEEQAQEYRLDWKYEVAARKLAEDEVDRLCKALKDKRRDE